MSRMKKFVSMLLTIVMVLAMAMPAMAVEGDGNSQQTAANGSITIVSGSTGVVASKKTFKAYRILDAKVSADGQSVTYSVPNIDALKQFYKRYFPEITVETSDASFSQAVVKQLANLETDSDALNNFAKAVLNDKDVVNALKSSGQGIANEQKGTYTISGLASGYYLVKDTSESGAVPISALALNTVRNGDTEITIKAEQPTIEKKIEHTDSTETEDDKNKASIGDTVKFLLESKIPDMTGYNKYFFYVTDTLSKGLTLVADSEQGTPSVTVKIGNHEITKGKKGQTEDYDYYVETKTLEGDKTEIKIVFHDFYKKNKDKAGEKIEIRYSAILNENANVGVNPNENDVYLNYSNDPNFSYKGDDEPGDKEPTGETPHDYTYTFTTGVQITKVDAENNAKKLAGAQFKISGDKVNTVVVIGDYFEEKSDGDYYKLLAGGGIQRLLRQMIQKIGTSTMEIIL